MQYKLINMRMAYMVMSGKKSKMSANAVTRVSTYFIVIYVA